MEQDFNQGVEFSHWLVKKHITEGELVIDATVGQGKDTKFLARLVGESGFVWGFDQQEKAINQTQANLAQAGLENRVVLIQAGHQHLLDYVNQTVAGIMFNLGYLPGSNKEIVTRPETTVQAVQAGLKLLMIGGIITLVVYLGHTGGKEEKQALINYVSELDTQAYNVLHYRFLNQSSAPPEVIAIKKRAKVE